MATVRRAVSTRVAPRPRDAIMVGVSSSRTVVLHQQGITPIRAFGGLNWRNYDLMGEH
jgi:hypothetical protein